MSWTKVSKGGSAASEIPTLNLTDGEAVKFNTSSGEFESANGEISIGCGQSINSGGANPFFKNTNTGLVRSAIDADYGSNIPKMRNIATQQDDVVQQAVNDATLINPSFVVVPVDNLSAVDITLDFDNLIDNVEFTLNRNGLSAWCFRYGQTTLGTQKVVFNVPMQIENDGATYLISITSPDGDVEIGGELATGIPEWSMSFSNFFDIANQTSPGSTGAIRGGDISTFDASNIVVTGGYGVIVNTVSTKGSIATHIAWASIPMFNAVSADGVFFIYVDLTGTVLQVDAETVPPTFDRDFINLGIVVVVGGVIIRSQTLKSDVNETHSQLFDILDCLGTTRCNGLVVNPDTGLEFSIDAGEMLARGSGTNTVGSRRPNTLVLTAVSPAVFDRQLGTTGVFITIDTTVLDPTQYDNAGVLTAVPVNDFTIQYIYKAPVEVGAVVVMYGQTIYANRDDALNATSTESFDIPSIVEDNYLLLGRII